MTDKAESIDWGYGKNRLIFQEDIAPIPNIPAPFNQRIIFNFFMKPCTREKQEALSKWMIEKWSDIGADGKEAWVNRMMVFFQSQTVILGECGHQVSSKVELLIIIA